MRANHYDFIVTGAGAAGRSFAYQLTRSTLRDKRVLLIDRAEKTADTHDRTWCFWEQGEGPFEAVVKHRWPILWCYQGKMERRLEIAPYQYKMILSGDYYAYTDAHLTGFPNVERLYGSVTALTQTDKAVQVTVDGVTYTADWCINSLPGSRIDKSRVNYLDQHFRGWFIRTEEPVFDPGEAVMMDFRIPQEGDFRFMYVLPTSQREALVEVAIFSNEHLRAEAYDQIIGDYLTKHWPGLGSFTVERREMGNIPMTDHPFTPHDGRIVNLGLHGGDTRASTGYTFLYIHRRVARIIAHLEQHGTPLAPTPCSWRRHRRYDQLMLRVLEQGLYPGDELFGQLFAKNEPRRLLSFLNAESKVTDELGVMSSAPMSAFLRALLQEMSR